MASDTTTTTAPGPPGGDRRGTGGGGGGGSRSGSGVPRLGEAGVFDATVTRIVTQVATMLVTTSWFPLFQGRSWFVTVSAIQVLAAGAAVAVTALTARRWAGTVAAVAALAMLAGLMLAPGTAVLGLLPGMDTAAALTEQAVNGMSAINSTPAPMAVDASVLTVVALTLCGLWFVADTAAVAARSPAVASLPLLAIYCVPAAILQDGLPTRYFILGALGLVGLLFVGLSERLRTWGRRVDSGRLPGATHVVAASVAALAVALSVPAALQFEGPSIMERVRGGQGGTGGGSAGGVSSALSPDLNLGRDLNRDTNRPLFSYRTSSSNPQPFKVYVVEAFDTDTWTTAPSGQYVQSGPSMAGGQGLGVPATPGTVDMEILGLRQTNVPVPPNLVALSSTEFTFDPEQGVLNAPTATRQGQELSMTYFDVNIPEDFQNRATVPGEGELAERYTTLNNVPGALYEAVDDVVTAEAPFRQAQQIQAWFRTGGGFQYSTQAPPQTGSPAMEAFLRTRSGYCVHYATAMTMMARIKGIPARVAVGTLPGVREDDTWTVGEQDAHAWPELYFDEVGWMRFEPTPSVRTGTAPEYSIPNLGQEPSATASESASASPSASATQAPDQETDQPAADSSSTSAMQRLSGFWPVAAILALVALALAAPRLVAAALRRRRWSRCVDEDDAAEVAWAQLEEQLDDLGLRWPGSATARTASRTVVDHLDASGGRDDATSDALRRRVVLVESARYAAPGSTRPGGAADHEDPVARARADVKSVVTAVGSTTDRRTRLVSAWLPRSIFRRGSR